MKRSRSSIYVLAAGFLALATAGCGAPSGDEAVAADTTVATDSAAGQERREVAATRAALPGLFNIMIGLQGDMARISRGLWLADFDSIAAGAEAVAGHPQVTADELQVVRGALGDDIVRFKELDTQVHDLAVQLQEQAVAGDTAAVLETDAALRAGCVTCHSEFRERLRTGIRRSTDGADPAADPAPDSAPPPGR